MTSHAPADPGRHKPDDEGLSDDQNADMSAYLCGGCGGLGVGTGEMWCCGEPMKRVTSAGATEPPELVDVLQHVLGMSKTELEVCIVLMRDGPMTTSEVADAIEVDGSYANRLLNHLVELDIVEERSYLLEAGGRVSRYSHAAIPDVERALTGELCGWAIEALHVIDEEIVAEKTDALASAHELVEEMSEGDEAIHYKP